MNRRLVPLLGLAALAVAHARPATAAPRITFTRRVAAAHDLGAAEEIAVVYAIGDSDKIATFLDVFIDRTNRSGALRVENAVDPVADIRIIRKRHPADVYLGVNQFRCTGREKVSEGSERDVDGGKVRRQYHFVDAVCEARIDVMSPVDSKRIFSFAAKGEGTSPRAIALTEEEREIAYDQAARYAAIAATESITPRIVRESIELDDHAPAFDDAYSRIIGERYDEARSIWESELRKHPDSAALEFDLAAVCEAAGDLAAAHRHFESARRLSPQDSRMRSEFHSFLRRNARP